MSSLPVLVLNSGSSSIKFSAYEAGDGKRTKLFEGAVDGIGTDLGKFWIKDAEGKKLVDQTPGARERMAKMGERLKRMRAAREARAASNKN